MPKDAVNSASSEEDVVNAIVSTLREVFGDDFIVAIEAQFDDVYRLSFRDSSIVKHPDKFAEAIQYAFRTSSNLIMTEINKKLGELLSLDFRYHVDLIESGTYGFVSLMSKIRKEILLIED